MKDPIQLTADGFVAFMLALTAVILGLLCFTVGLPFLLMGYLIAKSQEKK